MEINYIYSHKRFDYYSISQNTVSYFFLNLNLEIVFRHVDQGIFAAGIQHPLFDATLVPWHRINEDYKERRKGQ